MMIYSKEKLDQLRHRWNTPKGKKLMKIIKKSHCYLSPVLFRENVANFPCINDPEVEDSIDLRGISLSGFDFRMTVKEDDAGYTEELAILSEIHFEGASLRHCSFQEGKIHNCYFEGSDLSHSNFENSIINTCRFEEANCSGMNLQRSRLISCNFDNADIKDVSLNTTLVDQHSCFGKILKSEKEKNYHFAAIEYRQIKDLYKNSGFHSTADHYQYKEMVAKRKIAKATNPKRWLSYIFGDLLCKYGTSFTRVMLWSMVVIIACAFLHRSYNSLAFHNTKTAISFLDALYFSMASFTTVGYGDYHALGPMRFVAVVESFIGATLISLFTVIVARNLIRD